MLNAPQYIKVGRQMQIRVLFHGLWTIIVKEPKTEQTPRNLLWPITEGPSGSIC